jgi:hypothetical protein
LAQRGREGEGEQDLRERQRDVDDGADGGVHLPADESADQSRRDADEEAHDDRRHADEQRDPRTVELLGRIVWHHPRRGQRRAHDDEEDQHAREGGGVEGEPPPRSRAAGGACRYLVGDHLLRQGDGHQRSLIVGFR